MWVFQCVIHIFSKTSSLSLMISFLPTLRPLCAGSSKHTWKKCWVQQKTEKVRWKRLRSRRDEWTTHVHNNTAATQQHGMVTMTHANLLSRDFIASLFEVWRYKPKSSPTTSVSRRSSMPAFLKDIYWKKFEKFWKHLSCLGLPVGLLAQSVQPDQ